MSKRSTILIIEAYITLFEIWNQVFPTFMSIRGGMTTDTDDLASYIKDGVFIQTKDGSWEGPYFLNDIEQFTQNIQRWIIASKQNKTIN